MPSNKSNFDLFSHCHVNTDTGDDFFVGIKADSSNMTISFPLGYNLPKDEDNLIKEIKNLFKVLIMFTDKKDNTIHSNKNTNKEDVLFPIQAYFNVIKYFLEHNGKYYMDSKVVYKTKISGKINWNKTIKNQMPYITDSRAIYINPIVKYNTFNKNMIITQINKFCVREAFDKIGWLYTSVNPEKSDIKFNKNMFISILTDKLSSTNKDSDKELFQSMIDMILFYDCVTKNKKYYYGTDTFETIWEKLIDKIFGIPNKEDYFPHALWTERLGPNKGKKSSALQPDSIMFYKDKYYVLDAKYFRYGVRPDAGINYLPKTAEINKQITYAKFIAEQKINKDTELYNAFLIPYNGFNNAFGLIAEYCNVAEATGDWIVKPEIYERIQGIVIDTRHLMLSYNNNHDVEKNKLASQIELYLKP